MGGPGLDPQSVIVLSGIGVVGLVAVAVIYPRLKVSFKGKGIEAKLEGSQFPPNAPQQQPQSPIQNQVNIGRDQNNAARDILKADRDINTGDSYRAETIEFHDHHEQSAAPAPAALGLNQIPPPVADFVGRDDEIEKLRAAFDPRDGGRAALISGVRGMGGVGKTELAKLVAQRLEDHFRDGQIFFNLRGATDDDTLEPATAAEALQHVIRTFMPEAKLPEDVDQLKAVCNSVLHGKRVLILMDNARDAAQLAPLAPPPPGCALIVTSRNRFELAGMLDLDLDALPPEKARQMLLDICPRIGAHADAIAQSCGYLPLALRLAGSTLKLHPMKAVDSYLDDLRDEKTRLETLDVSTGQTELPHGVAASLAISYRLLDEQLQRLWRGLAVFPGDFDAPAAAAVWDREEKNAENALSDLYTASMIVWDRKTARFRLHDLARDFARECMPKAEEKTLAQAHATHYVEVLRTSKDLYNSGGDSVLLGLQIFEREWHNIRAGQAWAVANADFSHIATNLVNDYPLAGTSCVKLRLLPSEQIAWLEEAVKAARKLKDRNAQACHLGSLGLAYAAFGNMRQAIRCCEQAFEINRETGNRSGEGINLSSMGLFCFGLGEPRKALAYYYAALKIGGEDKDRRAESENLRGIGLACIALGEVYEAIEFFQESLKVDREIGHQTGEAATLFGLADAFAKAGQPHDAIAAAEKAMVISEQIGSPVADKARQWLERLQEQDQGKVQTI